jgi:hypothetical protein
VPAAPGCARERVVLVESPRERQRTALNVWATVPAVAILEWQHKKTHGLGAHSSPPRSVWWAPGSELG